MDNLIDVGLFFVSITLLAVMTVGALLWPVLRRVIPESADRRAVNLAIAKQRLRELGREHEDGVLSEETYEQAKSELALTLAGDLDDSEVGTQRTGGRWMALLIALAVPAAALWVYLQVGAPNFLGKAPIGIEAEQASAPSSAADIPALIVKLEERMAQTPNDPEGQRLLVRTYMAQGRFGDAIEMLERWGARDGDNPDLLVMLADATASMKEGQLQGEPEQLLKAALAQDPEHVQALWVLGYAQMQQSQPAEALVYWQRLLPLVKDDAEASLRLRETIAEVQANLANSAALPADTPDTADTADTAAKVVVDVSLSASIAAKVAPDDVVFVYARLSEGPPMPLAAVKLQVRDLPLSVTLDDGRAMIAEHTLSRYQRVVVGARVSLGGGPIAQSGDFYGEVANVDTGAKSAVALVIDQEK